MKELNWNRVLAKILTDEKNARTIANWLFDEGAITNPHPDQLDHQELIEYCLEVILEIQRKESPHGKGNA